MQSKQLHPKQTASPLGVSKAFFERKRWAGARVPPSPLDTLPMTTGQEIYCLKRTFWHPLIEYPLIEGVSFSFFQYPSTLGTVARRQIIKYFQGKNIINTHLLSFAWFAEYRAFACIVVGKITAHTKAFRDGANEYRKQSDVNDAMATIFFRKKNDAI